MNRYTFKDAATGARQSLVNDVDNLEDDEDDLEGGVPESLTEEIAGEEQEGGEKFNEAGEVIIPFNLKDERDGGHFDESGNYIWRKEAEEPDAWLANMDEAEMENAIGEAAAALKRKNDALEQLDKSQPAVHDREMLKIELLQILLPGETIPAALRRLGGGKLASVRKLGKKVIKPPPLAKVDSEAFSKLTDLADALIVLGFSDIYDMEYDSLDAILSTWEYKGQDGQVYGPYQGDQIVKWMKQGFFGGDGGVQMRKVVPPSGERMSESEPSAKRARFEETKSEVSALSNRDDLLNDLDDDSDSDPEATALMGGRKRALTKPAFASEIHATTYGPWVLSTDVDFGDVDRQDDNAGRDDD